MKTLLHLGRSRLCANQDPVRGRLTTIAGEEFYQIANYDRLRPFFLTVVSDSDHWLFISSNGGLTAGRRDADLALFPYYTDDKLRDMAEVSGSKTLLRVQRQGRSFLWEPFSARGEGVYRVRRNLYKSVWGNQLIFEEINDDLALTFRYGWCNSQRFGFVRRAWLANVGKAVVRLKLLDGIQNIMPCGTGSQFNLEYSTLLDAYKRSELLSETGLGLFRLSAIPIDRPEPAEALRTTVAWSLGLKRKVTLLSSVQLENFRSADFEVGSTRLNSRTVPIRRSALQSETDIRGERGAYLVQSEMRLPPGGSADWLIVADVNQGPSEVAQLDRLLRQPVQLRKLVLADVQHGTQELQRIVASADGLQQTAQPLGCARHYSNTLFNLMRGGVFADGYNLDSHDLLAFARNASPQLIERHAKFFRRRPKTVRYADMVAAAAQAGDPQLERVCREYLPLTFSRRHGDPSRPWNRFSITTRSADGTRSLNYEGNWRDIFQNWEALAVSLPGYTAGMICRFLNASTADGYNPYRITRNGIDWEVVDPHDPWSYIGYWGDHQIIYLLKLLELLDRHDPAELRALLGREIFAYANVPYRIKPYADLLANPKDTVVFDHPLERLIRERVQSHGADGKLVWDKRGQVRLVNLTEKLLVPLLAKLSNFIPGAGIWLNTQRPEWNDANNALVGNGCSMVTLYYLRRYLAFLQSIFAGDFPLPFGTGEGQGEGSPRSDRHALACSDPLTPARSPSAGEREFMLSAEVATFFSAIHEVLQRHRRLLSGEISDSQRKRVLDDLGRAGTRYRRRIYERGLSNRKTKLTTAHLLDFLSTALDWVNHSIQSNRRRDGLYHAYNLVRFDSPTKLPIRRLYEMLEGQVAVLSSGQLSAEESLDLLTALRRSALYRADQHSYLLYPNRELPHFAERNIIPRKELRRSKLLRQLLADGNRQLVERDVAGRVHFHATITNARDVRRILDRLAATPVAALARRETPLVLEIFERLFDHESFTGRSGTFFGYEGLGSIYWHMVSKLLLAALETYFRALDSGAPANVLQGLADCYYDIRAGIGDCKSPENYGAFPMDPYSHTPAHAGARQPGLTGQVKEDILCRWGELGVFVEEGRICFHPRLLRRVEFLTKPARFRYLDLAGMRRSIPLPPRSLAFTYCQTPVIYRLAEKPSLVVARADGNETRCDELQLDAGTSRDIFDRTGRVGQIEVALKI